MIRFALLCGLVGLVVALTYSALLGTFWFLVGAGIAARACREPEAPQPKALPQPRLESSATTYNISSRGRRP
jgi:hypothetical protein